MVTGCRAVRVVRRFAYGLAATLAIGPLAGSAFLALLRMTAPTARRLVELTVAVPAGLPLAALATLLAVGLALTRGRRWWVVVAASLVLVCAHGWWQAPLFLGSPPEAAGDARLRLLTQNLEYGDPDAVLDVVEADQVDVLVLADTTAATLEPVLASRLVEILPHAVGVDPPGGTVVLSRFPLRDDKRISDGGDSRVMTLDIPDLGPIDLVVLHPTQPQHQPKWTDDHQRIRTFLEDRYGIRPDTPVIVAGDLNATLDHAPMRALAGLGYTDAAVQVNAGWLPTWPEDGSAQRLGVTLPPIAAIDHVLTSPALAVTGLSKVDVGSDHLGLVAGITTTRG